MSFSPSVAAGLGALAAEAFVPSSASAPRPLALLTGTLLALLAASCASAAAESRELRFAHYSVALPPGWNLIQLDEERQAAVAELRDSPSHFVMRVFLSTAGDRDGKTLSSDDFANAFRDNEERIMIEEGVEKGQYELTNVVKTEEVHGGKVFHAMHYATINKEQAQSASLYLYFPHEDRVREFVVIHYSEYLPQLWSWGRRVTPPDRPSAGFRRTLASLKTNEIAVSAPR